MRRTSAAQLAKRPASSWDTAGRDASTRARRRSSACLPGPSGDGSSVCHAAFTAAAASCRARATAAPSARASRTAASSARATAVRWGPSGRTNAGAMQTSHASAAATATSARWRGISPSRCGRNAQVALMNVKIRLPGGPIRAASHATLCAAASSAATRTRTGADRVSPAAVSATPTLTTMLVATPSRVRTLTRYGRPCA
ncbi:hypothetical protein [Microbispora sp. GKU 823]|uniref:hypothetical protein n=1 Tax=Microbispora sp. GKU 823 TaxID=1652100 RepID=UPI001C4DFFB3|nr:hypothetical protein [Microbispora sp. GKU 823]